MLVSQKDKILNSIFNLYTKLCIYTIYKFMSVHEHCIIKNQLIQPCGNR